MSTPEKEPIPQTFLDWAREGEKNFEDTFIAATYFNACVDAYRHLSSQPSPSLMEWILDFGLFLRGKVIEGTRTNGEIKMHLQHYLDANPLRSSLSSQPSPGLQFVNGSEREPKNDYYDEPSTYLVRIKGDDPRSGWVWVGYMTLEQMQTDILGDYWEWLEETPSVQPIEGEQKDSFIAFLDERIEWENNKKPQVDGLSGCEWEFGNPAQLLEIKEEYQKRHSKPPEAQPIADKEVPREIVRWIHEQIPCQYRPTEDMILNRDYDHMTSLEQDREALEEIAIAMYHKMQEEATLKKIELNSQSCIIDDLKAETSTQAIQIASLLASNKEWGEKYAAMEKEGMEYRNMLQIFSDARDESTVRRSWIEIDELLAKYSSPTTTR